MSDIWADDRQRLTAVVDALSDLSCTLLEYAADNGPLGDTDIRETCLMALSAGEVARGAALLARRAVELLPKPVTMDDLYKTGKEAEVSQEELEWGWIATENGKVQEQTWNTQQLQHDFKVVQFAAPFVHVVRKSDGMKGTLQFQHRPRIYWDFTPAVEQ